MTEANAAERRRWNDPVWTALWLGREQVTAPATPFVVEHLGLGAGQRVLEIGSGGGGLAMAAATRVGSEGSVVGVDISAGLVDVARTRVERAGLVQVRFVVADMQTDRIDGQPFDVAMSQFGVMFFDEPVRAFSNVARHVEPGGRLVFACWQRAEANPWHIGATLAPFVRPVPDPAPGKSRTGPFVLGDPDRVVAVLESAGWGGIERTTYERTEVVSRRAIVGEDDLGFAGVEDAHLDQARAAVADHVARFERPDGDLEIPIAFQIFAARRR